MWLTSGGWLCVLLAFSTGSETFCTGPVANDGIWHHCVWQWSSSTPTMGQQLWLDGGLRISGSQTHSNYQIDQLIFGAIMDGTTWCQNWYSCYDNYWYWPGQLDDLAIFNRVLSIAEIGQLYGGAVPPYPQANSKHCVGLVSSTEGSYGFEITRLPPTLTALSFESGRGPSFSAGSAAVAPSPAFDPLKQAGYTVSVASFVTGLRVSAGMNLPPGDQVFVTHGGAVPAALSSGEWSG
jgi:hypothetical protein